MGARLVTENDLTKLATQDYEEYEVKADDETYFLYAAPNIILDDEVNVTMKKFLWFKKFDATGAYPKMTCQLKRC